MGRVGGRVRRHLGGGRARHTRRRRCNTRHWLARVTSHGPIPPDLELVVPCELPARSLARRDGQSEGKEVGGALLCGEADIAGVHIHILCHQLVPAGGGDDLRVARRRARIAACGRRSRHAATCARQGTDGPCSARARHWQGAADGGALQSFATHTRGRKCGGAWEFLPRPSLPPLPLPSTPRARTRARRCDAVVPTLPTGGVDVHTLIVGTKGKLVMEPLPVEK